MIVFVPDICIYMRWMGILHAPLTQIQTQTLGVNRSLSGNFTSSNGGTPL